MRYPVYRAKFKRVDYVDTENSAIFAQRLEAFTRDARQRASEIRVRDRWRSTPLPKRLVHAFKATLPAEERGDTDGL